MQKISKFFVLTTVLSLSAFSVSGQDLTRGLEAYRARDYATAVEELLSFAEQGTAVAQDALGWIYISDTGGVRRDYVEAVKWFRLAAAQGIPSSQWGLGTLYVRGDGVAQDYAEAAIWYRLAANQGDSGGQYSLARLYEEGNGVGQDLSEALKLYELAAAQGHNFARSAVLRVQRAIREAATDEADARYDADTIEAYRIAAGEGDAGAQHQLGLIYAQGLGVLQDYIQAHMWLNIASANGFEEAREWRDEYLAARMSAADIIKAQSAAAQCMNSGYQDC